MTTSLGTGPILGALARQEIRQYLRHKLFWVGVALTSAVATMGIVGPEDPRGSTGGDGIVPALVIGVFGLIVMSDLTRRSDRAAAAAGAVAVPERTRTLALACAAVVPFGVGCLWLVAALVGLWLHPSQPSGPFGPANDAFVTATMVEQGVISCIGGPLLGLLLARWVRFRGAAPIAAVLLVVVTIVMQGGLVTATTPWREVWVWVHFHAPIGTLSDHDQWVVLTGSPYWFIGYQLSLCALGVLAAVWHDPHTDRARLNRVMAGVVVVSVALCFLAITGGIDEIAINPIPSPNAG